MVSGTQLTIELPNDLDEFVRDKVRRGGYGTEGEFVRELLRERYLQEQPNGDAIARFEVAMAEGLADAQSGRGSYVDEAFDKLHRELRARSSATDR
jgi:antitoxin ParD1/3/4